MQRHRSVPKAKGRPHRTALGTERCKYDAKCDKSTTKTGNSPPTTDGERKGTLDGSLLPLYDELIKKNTNRDEANRKEIRLCGGNKSIH